MESHLSLENKVALVTGSSRGIGWAVARILAQHGATVILNGRNDATLLNQRVTELKSAYGREAEGFLFDAGDPARVRECYAAVFKKYKRLDILINNAGIFESSLLGMLQPEKIEVMFRTNVQSAILNMQYASRLMAHHKSGSIVNLSSIIGRVGSAGQVVYGGTKAALIGITLSAAKELAPMGIRVNAVAPGFIETDLIRSLGEEQRKAAVQSIKMGRAGTPDDVAKVILFFASDLSSYVTGQVLGVDGGMVM